MELYIVYCDNSWGNPQVRTIHTDPALAKAECEELLQEYGKPDFVLWRWRAIKAGERL